jgi:hypothetical protein
VYPPFGHGSTVTKVGFSHGVGEVVQGGSGLGGGGGELFLTGGGGGTAPQCVIIGPFALQVMVRVSVTVTHGRGA